MWMLPNMYIKLYLLIKLGWGSIPQKYWCLPKFEDGGDGLATSDDQNRSEAFRRGRVTLWLQVYQCLAKTITVKPVLTATSEQRPPVNNGQSEAITASLRLTFPRSFSGNPLYNDHIFQVPSVDVVHRFDCTSLWVIQHRKYVKVILYLVILQMIHCKFCIWPCVFHWM